MVKVIIVFIAIWYDLPINVKLSLITGNGKYIVHKTVSLLMLR